MKAVIGVLVLLVGGFVLYKVLPVYWSDFKLGEMLQEQATMYTFAPTKSTDEIATSISEKAHDLDVQLTPQQIVVKRDPASLSISTEYTVHVDLPIYPLDLNFKTASKSKDAMK